MGHQQNVVVINGKRYNAATGRLLETAPAHNPKTSSAPTTGKVMDGFVRRPAADKKPAASRTTHPAKQIHTNPEHSKTLMRHVVKKPKVAEATHSASAPTVQAIRHDVASPARLHRANSIKKHNLISRFGSSNSQEPREVKHKTDVLPVKAPPITVSGHAMNHHQTKAVNHHQPSAISNPFHRAMELSTTHEEPRPKKLKLHHKVAHRLHVSPRTVNLASFLVAFGLLAGFITYQNIPNLAVKVAAARAGVRAQLPSYKPAGFSMKGPINYSPGQITISFRSNSDDRAFQVTQRNSEWNSETLLNNFVSLDRRAYQTYQDKGKTIFIYDGSNATWVDSGVWYQVEGNSSLSSDQLIRIANSL